MGAAELFPKSSEVPKGVLAGTGEKVGGLDTLIATPNFE